MADVFVGVGVNRFILAVGDLIDLGATQDGVIVGVNGLAPDVGCFGFNPLIVVIPVAVSFDAVLQEVSHLTGGKLLCSSAAVLGFGLGEVVAVFNGAIVAAEMANQLVGIGVTVRNLAAVVTQQAADTIAAALDGGVDHIAVSDRGIGAADQAAHIIRAFKPAVDHADVLDIVIVIGVAEQACILALSDAMQAGDGMTLAVKGAAVRAPFLETADGYPVGSIFRDHDIGSQDRIGVVRYIVNVIGEPVELTGIGDLVNALILVVHCRLIAAADAEAVGVHTGVVLVGEDVGLGFGVFLAVKFHGDGLGFGAGILAIFALNGFSQDSVLVGNHNPVHAVFTAGAEEIHIHIVADMVGPVEHGSVGAGVVVPVHFAILAADSADSLCSTGGFADGGVGLGLTGGAAQGVSAHVLVIIGGGVDNFTALGMVGGVHFTIACAADITDSLVGAGCGAAPVGTRCAAAVPQAARVGILGMVGGIHFTIAYVADITDSLVGAGCGAAPVGTFCAAAVPQATRVGILGMVGGIHFTIACAAKAADSLVGAGCSAAAVGAGIFTQTANTILQDMGIADNLTGTCQAEIRTQLDVSVVVKGASLPDIHLSIERTTENLSTLLDMHLSIERTTENLSIMLDIHQSIERTTENLSTITNSHS